MGDAQLRCTGCKTATYWYVQCLFKFYTLILNTFGTSSDDKCQKAHWSSHKKECKMHRVAYDMEQEEKAKPIPKPRRTHCTGCNTRFSEDDVYVDQECPDCGYMTCESCSCSNSRGACTVVSGLQTVLSNALFFPGSCYCTDSNFGHLYCSRGQFLLHPGLNHSAHLFCFILAEPAYYHTGRHGGYAGDYHPKKEDFHDLNREDYPEYFEDQERPCNRCGDVAYCLKKEYRTAY